MGSNTGYHPLTDFLPLQDHYYLLFNPIDGRYVKCGSKTKVGLLVFTLQEYAEQFTIILVNRFRVQKAKDYIPVKVECKTMQHQAAKAGAVALMKGKQLMIYDVSLQEVQQCH